MRRKARLRRRRQARLVAGPGAAAVAAAGGSSPRCCTCGKPLPRLAGCAADPTPPGFGFQCEQCFYPGTGRSPLGAGVVCSERARVWGELGEPGGSGDPSLSGQRQG